MQLRYNQTIRKNIVLVDLEAIKFTARELEAFARFGDPMIIVDKLYPVESENPTFPVKIERKLRSSFKLRIKFDGTEDMTAALEAAESFYDDIRSILQDTLIELTDKLDDSIVYEMGSGIDIIRTGTESFPSSGCHRPIDPPRPPFSSICNTPPSHHISKPKPHDCKCCDDDVVWIDGESVYY